MTAGPSDTKTRVLAVNIRLKRVYEEPTPADGDRILVERLWPRGVAKSRAGVDLWAKEAAPSTALRKWFDHDPARWTEFKRRYYRELDSRPDVVRDLVNRAQNGDVTFVFASSESRWNNAVALKEYIEKHTGV